MTDKSLLHHSERVAAAMTAKAVAFGRTHPSPESAREVAAALTQEAIAAVRKRP